ncbi:hypothetical protein [Nocardioides aquiterrae]|uniref:hypothetical protein n=1 Tax=Nocardioides aquiterrae TaxID=203799 RepID=UPI0031E0D90D
MSSTDQSSQPEETTPPPMRGDLWTARRQGLYMVLASQDPLIGGLYRRAVHGLSERPLQPDVLVVTAHAVRELVNRLPRVLGQVPVDNQSKKGRGESAARVALARELAAAGLNPADSEGLRTPGPAIGRATSVSAPADPSDPIIERTTSDSSNSPAPNAPLTETVAVPRSLLEAVLDLAAVHREGSSRAVNVRAALVADADGVGGADATVTMFKRAIDDFEECRHPGYRDLPVHFFRPPEHYVAQFEVIERVLESRLGRFLDIVADLRVLLERANQQQNGAWVAPDPALVDQVLPRIGDPQHRRVFFNGLRNPLWVRALDARGVFDDPPTHVVTDAGLMPYMPWPQGDYLYTVASIQHEAIATILNRVITGGTAWNVRELLVRCAAQMPGDAAVALSGKIAAAIDDRQVGPHIGTEVLDVIEHLVTDGYAKTAKVLVHKLLEPKPAADTGSRFARVTAGIDTDWYAEALERAVTVYDGDRNFFIWLTWWLDRHQTHSGAHVPGERDHTTLRRPSIGEHPHNRGHDDVGEALIDTVRDLAIARIREHGPADVADILHRPSAPVLRRIELYALAQTVHDHPDVVAVASDRLLDPELNDGYTYLHELKQLAAAALPVVDDDTYRAWEQPILTGPTISDATRERITSHYGAGDSEAAVVEFTERWQLSRLEIIDADALRGPARALRERLLAKERERYSPGDQTGDEGEPDLAAMTPREVLDLLSINRDDVPPDSIQRRDRLARALEVDVTRRPRAYTQVADTALTLPSGYVHRYISGLREHVRAVNDAVKTSQAEQDNQAEPAGQEQGPTRAVETVDIDWDRLLDTLLTSRTWREDNHTATDFGTWRWVRQEICSLLEYATSPDLPGHLPGHLRPIAAAIVTEIVSDTDPSPETEERYGDGWDPYTCALNTVRPTAVRTLLGIARADTTEHQRTHPGDTNRTLLADAAIQTVTGLLTPERDHSLTIAATIGERAGWLLSCSRDWLNQHQTQLLAPDPFGDTFVTTAIALHNPHPMLIDYLAPAIGRMLQRATVGEHLTNGIRDETPLKLIGNHLAILNVWGRIDYDHPLLAQFFTDAPVDERAGVLGGLGWQFFHADALDDDIRDRAAALWDHRLAAVRAGETDATELSGFDWWIRCGHFARAWWLPRLRELARNYQFEGRIHIGDELEATSEENPEAAIDVLDGLLRGAPDTVLHYGLRQAAPVVIARALEHGTDEAAQTADNLMNFIARNGGIDIENEVEERRQQERRAQEQRRQVPAPEQGTVDDTAGADDP